MKSSFSFIGSALIRYLISNTDHAVINIDKLTYAGNTESLYSVESSSRYSFEKIDICNQELLEKIFNKHKPDVVMHLAAESHVDRSIHSPAAFIETNIIGTYSLLEVSRKYWQGMNTSSKDNFRFHHISTDEVYGDLPHPDAVDDAIKYLFQESTAYKPSSPYSASKASSDHMVRAWMRTYGLPSIVTNCSNNYGPFQYPEKLIPLIIFNALNEKAIPVYGKGDQIRDWLYVDDHIKALMEVVTRGKIGETYNIGGHNEKRNIEVVETICDSLQVFFPNKKSFRNLITYVEDRPGHDRRYAIDSSKIQHELGWKPAETFETGINKTIAWYLDNLSWYENIKKE